MGKSYLLTIASKTEGTSRFAKSLEKIQVEHISVQFKPYIDDFPATKKEDKRYPGNLARYDFVPQLDDNRFIIFSDTDDVLFQKDTPDFERLNYEVYLAPENVSHKDSYWKGFIERNPYFEPLYNQPVYNAGLYAMRGKIFYELIKFMKFHIRFVKDDDKGQADQLLFNLFFIKNPHYDIYKGLDIFCPLYRNYELKKVYTRKGLFFLDTGLVPFAIHANGNTKQAFTDARSLIRNRAK